MRSVEKDLIEHYKSEIQKTRKERLELVNKINSVEVQMKHYNHEIEKIKEQLIYKREELKEYRTIKEKEEIININAIEVENEEPDKETQVNNQDQEEDFKLISEITEKYVLKLSALEEFPKKLPIEPDEEFQQLSVRAVLVVFIPNSYTYKLQTFNISHKTCLQEFKDGFLKFWNIDGEDECNYDLMFVDAKYNPSPINCDKYEIINLFLKSKSEMTKAVFYYVHKSVSGIATVKKEEKKEEKVEELDNLKSVDFRKNSANMIENESLMETIPIYKTIMQKLTHKEEGVKNITINESISKLLIARFIGLSAFMTRKLAKITNPDYKPQSDRAPFTNVNLIFNIILIIFYIMNYFLVTLVLNEMNPDTVTYFTNNEILEEFSQGLRSGYLKFIDAHENIKKAIASLSKKNKYNNYIVLGDVVIDVYFAKGKECALDLTQYGLNDTCAEPNILNPTQCDSTILVFTDFKTEVKDKLNYQQILKDNMVRGNGDIPFLASAEDEFMNFFFDDDWNIDYTKFDLYIENAYTNFAFSSTKIDPKEAYLIEGKEGVYRGEGNRLTVTPYLQNELLINTIYSAFIIENKLLPKTLRSVVVKLNLYSPQLKRIYIIEYLCEFTSYSTALPYKMKVNSLVPNFFFTDDGKFSRNFYIDIIRVALVTVFFFNLFVIFKRKIQIQFYQVTICDLFSFIFSQEILFNIIIFIMTILSFYLKYKYLNVNVMDMTAKTKNKDGYLETRYQNLYDVYTNYVIITFLDSIQLIFLNLLLLTLAFGYRRLRPTAEYISSSLKRALVFIVIHMAVIIVFAVIGHILYGPYNDDMIDSFRSMLVMLLLSVGHVRKELFDFDSSYGKLFICFYVLVVLFYVSMIYFGMFLESYRICSLRKGYSYYQNSEKLDKKPETQKKSDKLKESGTNNENNEKKGDVVIELAEKKEV